MATRKTPKKTARETVREQSREAYRELILVAAETIFASHGFAGARISDVAKEAGVATGTLYNYFDGKTEIFQSLMELRSREIADQLTEIYDSEHDPIDRLGALVRFVLAYLDEHVASYAIFVELGGVSEASISMLGGDEVVEHYVRYVQVFERAVRSAVRAKRLAAGVGKPADLAAMLTGAINGLARAWVASGHSESLTDKSDLVIHMFMNGVAK